MIPPDYCLFYLYSCDTLCMPQDAWASWAEAIGTITAIAVAILIPLYRETIRLREKRAAESRIAAAATTRLQVAIYPMVSKLAADAILLQRLAAEADATSFFTLLRAMTMSVPEQVYSALDAAPVLEQKVFEETKSCVTWLVRCQSRLEQVHRVFTSPALSQSLMRGDVADFNRKDVIEDVKATYVSAIDATIRLLKIVDPTVRITAKITA